MIDDVSTHTKVATIDVRDYTKSSFLATRDIYADGFATPNVYQVFSLPFKNGVAKDQLEFRANWTGATYIKQDQVYLIRD